MKNKTFVTVVVAVMASCGIALPVLEKRDNGFCYNYPNTRAGDYVAKRDLSSPTLPTTDLAIRAISLSIRSIPTHLEWCVAGSTIYIQPQSIGLVFGIAQTVVDSMLVEAVDQVNHLIAQHGPGALLPLSTWNFISGQDSQYDIHVHGYTTYLVLRDGLEGMFTYMAHYNAWGTGVYNFFDHVGIDVAQALIRFNPD